MRASQATILSLAWQAFVGMPEEEKLATVARLRQGIEELNKARPKRSISARSIRDVTGLDYATISRNPEALKLFRDNSSFLATRRKRRRHSGELSAPRDPLLNYKKAQLVQRLRDEMAKREALEASMSKVVEERAETDKRIMRLEAEVGRYESKLQHLRQKLWQEETD